MPTEASGERTISLVGARRPHDLVINGRFLTQAVTGVQRYAREVVQALDDLLADGELPHLSVEIIAPKNLEAQQYRAIPIRAQGRLGGHAWEQLELPRLTGGRPLLNLCNSGPASLKRQIVTIHDAAVFARPEAYSFAFRAWYRALLKRLAHRSLGVITPSQFSKSDIEKWCRVDPKRIEAIAHGHEHVTRTPPDPSILNGIERPFVLAVSSMTANKNFAAIAQALEPLEEIDVLIAGGRNRRVFADGTRLPKRFRTLGYVTDGQLRALYERALCLVYPSWYEGFGFPALEAMACGCPVVASRSASLPEVCGDAAIYCDAADPQSIARAVQKLHKDPAVGLHYSATGRARAAAFTWRASALQHVDCVERLVHA